MTASITLPAGTAALELRAGPALARGAGAPGTGPVTLPPGAGILHLSAVLELARGGRLGSPVLAFERQGPADAPCVVVQGGISAGRHVSAHRGASGPGWWEGFVGEGLGIDTARCQVLAIDWLGGVGASTGPGPYGASFPFVGTEDQADAVASLLDHLRIGRLRAFVGASYGGMVGLQFAARHPARLDRLLCLGAAHESHAQASAWRAVQRGIVALGEQHGCAGEALALARQLAMTTYRSPRELQQRFAGPGVVDGGALRTPVQAWLEHHGRAFAERWSAAAFRCLNASIDGHRVDPAAVRVPVWLVSFHSDQLVPVEQIAALARALPRCERHWELATIFGHDAFLKERRHLLPILSEVLR
jgi:homoserine O-acetyltransferase